MTIEKEVLLLLDATLGLRGRGLAFVPETRLLGALPEFDSMTIINLVTGLEDRFGVLITDDEIEGRLFATVGSLLDFVRHKVGSPQAR
ncbi:MAG: acyl carrier protein [Rugosibacter sp.]|nr:acyl carrier protein [Rugosibacter sp.]